MKRVATRIPYKANNSRNYTSSCVHRRMLRACKWLNMGKQLMSNRAARPNEGLNRKYAKLLGKVHFVTT